MGIRDLRKVFKVLQFEMSFHRLINHLQVSKMITIYYIVKLFRDLFLLLFMDLHSIFCIKSQNFIKKKVNISVSSPNRLGPIHFLVRNTGLSSASKIAGSVAALVSL